MYNKRKIIIFSNNVKKMVLLLNADYSPINTINFKKASKMIYKKKAEVIDCDKTRKIYKDDYLPTVIRLVRYVNLPYKKVTLTRHNIFKRDDYRCAYCGSESNLTIDHIIPRSKGGGNNWENLITSCLPCNNKKDNLTLEEANMKLLYQPYKPNYISFLYKAKIKEDWKKYIYL